MLGILSRPWFRRIWALKRSAARQIIKCGKAETGSLTFSTGFLALAPANGQRNSDLEVSASPVLHHMRAIFRPVFKEGGTPTTRLSFGSWAAG